MQTQHDALKAVFRTTLFLLGVAGITTAAHAQTASSRHDAQPPLRVVITTKDGTTIGGTLLSLTGQDVRLTTGGNISSTALADVRQIVTPADPVWDGALKGAVIPLVVWAIWCRECDAGFMLRTTLSSALIGLTWDALQANRKTLYRGTGRSATLTWQVAF